MRTVYGLSAILRGMKFPDNSSSLRLYRRSRHPRSPINNALSSWTCEMDSFRLQNNDVILAQFDL